MNACLTLETDRIPQSWEFAPSGLTQDEMVTQAVPRVRDSTLVGTERREKEFRDCRAAVRSYRTLPVNWDKYGGVAISAKPLTFAENLLQELASTANVSAPLVRPISGGVYIEWRLGDAILYFEADDESVLEFSRTAIGELTAEDSNFDWERAYETVKSFFDNAA